MKFEKIDCGNGIAVAVSSDSMIITDVDSALDLLMSAQYEAGTKYIVCLLYTSDAADEL